MLKFSSQATASNRVPGWCLALLVILSACAQPGVEQSERESVAIDRSLRMVAMSAEQRGDHATALTYYRQLYRNDPDDVANLLGYARSLRASDSAGEAVNILQQILSDGPENGAVLAELGRAQLAIGDMDGAIRSLTDAITAGNGEWPTFLALGVAHDRRGGHTAAQQAYEGALTLSKDNLAVMNNLALSYALDGSIDTGIRILERAAAMPRATIQIRQNLALLYGINGDTGPAAKMAAIDLDEKAVQRNLAYYEALRNGAATLEDALQPPQPAAKIDLPPDAGSLRVELGGSPTVESAIDLWESVRTRHQKAFSGLDVEVVKRKLSNGASQFLTWAGPISSRSQGEAICAELKSNNVRCAIVSP